MTSNHVKMVMLDGTITLVPSNKVDEMVKYAHWKILSKMNVTDIRKLPAATQIVGYDQMNKKDLLEAL